MWCVNLFKHEAEWPFLVEVGRLNRLSTAETVLLFALREVEDGPRGNEFNLLRVKDTDLAMQANGMAHLLRSAEFQYQKYLRGQEGVLKLKAGSKPLPFIEFFRYPIFTTDVGVRDQYWTKRLEDVMDQIDKKFSTKEK